MKFVFDNNGQQITANMSEKAGLYFARINGYTILSMERTEPTPITQSELEEMLLDQEYRITLLEMGVIVE